ncbi:MAG: hypothetical protein HC821_05975, partial [Lewinella sp.]|nr:hypothetical protein [Lewinella sp.]
MAGKAATSPEFSPLITSFERSIEQLASLELAYQRAKSDLADREEALVESFGEAAVANVRQEIDPFLNTDFANLLFDQQEAPEVINAWLQGKEAYEHYLANPSLGRYDQLFNDQQTSLEPEELRAAGLTGIRELLARRQRLAGHYERLIQARWALDELKAQLSRFGTERSIDEQKSDLAEILTQEQIHFSGSKIDSLRLQYLRNLLEEVVSVDEEQAALQLSGISERLNDLTLARNDLSSPNYERINPPARLAESYPDIQTLTTQVNQEFDLMFSALETYSQRNAGNLLKAHRNAANFETVFGL